MDRPESKPMWLFGVFDAEWDFLDVVAWPTFGVELADLGFKKMLRLRDAAVTDPKIIYRETMLLRRAFRGKSRTQSVEKGEVTIRRCRATLVDRMPPNK